MFLLNVDFSMLSTEPGTDSSSLHPPFRTHRAKGFFFFLGSLLKWPPTVCPELHVSAALLVVVLVIWPLI